jgi:hypothetical protein
MAVRVDKAGYERPAAQVHHARLGTLQFHHLVAVPGGDDAPAPDSERLDLRLEFVDGDDGAAGVYGIGGCHRGGERKRWREACGDGQHDGRRAGQMSLFHFRVSRMKLNGQSRLLQKQGGTPSP